MLLYNALIDLQNSRRVLHSIMATINIRRIPSGYIMSLMHRNTPYCYCKISGLKPIKVAQYIRTVLLAFTMRLQVSMSVYNAECRLSCSFSLVHIRLRT